MARPHAHGRGFLLLFPPSQKSTRSSLKARNLKTARCLLYDSRHFLLVEHATWNGRPRGKWGIPGGRIEPYEDAEPAARRELQEELYIDVGTLHPLGEYRYKGARHAVFGGHYSGSVDRFDSNEIAQIGWFTLEQIVAIQERDGLHAGFELTAARALLELPEGALR